MPIVRVAILADSRLTEMALPAELPLREILPAVQRLVVPAAGNGDAAEPGDTAPQLSLAPVGGAPFSLDASLDTVGVVDGDLLALQPVPAGPAAPGIVEDIADAAMIFSTSRRNPWGPKHIQRGALAAVIGVTLVATGLAVAHRLATGALAGLVAASAIAALVAITGLLTTARSPRTGIALSITALVPIAAALALAVPGKFGTAHLVLAAAGVAAWSFVALIVPSAERERAAAFFTASAVVSLAIALAGGAELLWQLPILTLGCGLIVAALFVTIQAAQLSALWARFPLPVIPAPGDPTPAPPALRVLEDLPRRVRIGDAHQNGFIAAAVLLSVLGSVAIALRPETLSVAGWYVVGATSLAATLRARVWDSVACKAWLLAQPFLVAGVLLVYYVATGRYTGALVAVTVLAVLVLAWVVVALNPGIAAPESYSLPLRRLLGFVSAGLDASLIPVMAFLVGLFAWVLNR
ncbi:type VII secretion integral membrane protein EccD [Mycobacterium vicinigordonae]|uniref:Type VII secretion integral membrane protein EccD n=1 Tax=Mycobacterium vicinigordonae TaxID=1719132 RepID=A0A7D6I138_9MYCO|nr:type VII secretion integral membrane protein EccD [Mycobacterium vicinigordonae]QLL09955.1 type VII secretion integral membrane protein EccD [Mycobacterium vicinigordonae]